MTMPIEAVCPECGYAVDDATVVEDGKLGGDTRPASGNIAICIQCAGLGVYTENGNGTLGLRLPTFEEKVELSEDEEITKVRATIVSQSIWMKP